MIVFGIITLMDQREVGRKIVEELLDATAEEHLATIESITRSMNLSTCSQADLTELAELMKLTSKSK